MTKILEYDYEYKICQRHTIYSKYSYQQETLEYYGRRMYSSRVIKLL